MLGIDQTPYQLPGLSLVVSPFVYVFGDNHFAWRIPIIIFGMAFLYFYYKVVEHISNKKISLLSTIILALSPMIFVHSSLMLRDIPVLALGFLALHLYFKNKYYFAAFIIGLAALIKETAIFFAIFIALWSTIKFIKNNEGDYRKIISMKSETKQNIKKSAIYVIIISISFLTPLIIYENTIQVLEYETIEPEFFTYDENGNIENIVRFEILQTDPFVLEKPINEFNYINKVTDPIHHLQLFFGKGYYDTAKDKERNEFTASFLPIEAKYDGQIKFHIEGDTKIKNISANGEVQSTIVHQTDFTTDWTQSVVNYSYWHVAFWGILMLVTYATYDKIKNQKPISNQILFLILGWIFFIPFLVIDQIRASYAYYMIPFLPFMALGLILLIYKIRDRKIRMVVLGSFLIAIFANFVFYFPVKII